jgi:hypothetical protein
MAQFTRAPCLLLSGGMLQTNRVPCTGTCFLDQAADAVLRFRTLLYAHVKLAKYGSLRHPVLSRFARGS